jgi:Primase C terminal 2 (PriCT-2)/Family of unknown function (DUF5906)
MGINTQSQVFLQSIFGSKWPQAWVEWWKFDKATGKVDPSTHRWARAKDADPTEDHSVYFCVGLIAEGKRRALENVLSVHALVLDDVGTKVDKEFADTFEPLPLSCEVQTSLGNWQYMWTSDEGFTVDEFRALRYGLVEVYGPCDAGSPVQLVRMPMGVNGKWEPSSKRNFHIRVTQHFHNTKAAIMAAFPPPAGGGGASSRDERTAAQAPSLEAVRVALEAMPNDGKYGYDQWIAIGIALHHCRPDDECFDLWVEWSRQSPICGVQFTPEDKWETFRTENPTSGWGTIEIEAKRRGGGPRMADEAFDDGVPMPDAKVRVTRLDFFAHMETGKFVYFPTGMLWPATSVNARLGPSGVMGPNNKMVPMSEVLKRTRAVDQVSWMPGRPQIVRNVVVTKAGVEVEPDNVVLNLYRAPLRVDGVAQHSLPWRRHLEMLYPDDAEWITKWMAHCIQKPWEKKNHALVLGGKSGVGKDTILYPLILGVGGQNWAEATPTALMGRFNAFLQAVVLRISEVHNLGENLTRRKLYEHLKPILASPPETLQIDAKNVEVRSILNVVSVLMTTNYRHEGFYLPEEDRRHYMAWTEVTEREVKQNKGGDYYAKLHKWMDGDGAAHVVAYLRAVDISQWDAKAPPPKTRWWHSVVGVSTQDVNDEALADAIAAMGHRAVFSKEELTAAADTVLQAWIDDPKNTRAFPARLHGEGYERIPSSSKGGRWKLKDYRNVSLYGKISLPVADQIRACEVWVAKKNEEIEKANKKF